MRTAIVSGCFDPITVGHFDIIKRAALLFDNVVVAISANSEKKSLFSENLRVKMVKASVAEFDNVRVELCAGLLAEFCSRFENPVIVRGARSGSEFDYERSLFRHTRNGCFACRKRIGPYQLDICTRVD